MRGHDRRRPTAVAPLHDRRRRRRARSSSIAARAATSGTPRGATLDALAALYCVNIGLRPLAGDRRGGTRPARAVAVLHELGLGFSTQPRLTWPTASEGCQFLGNVGRAFLLLGVAPRRRSRRSRSRASTTGCAANTTSSSAAEGRPRDDARRDLDQREPGSARPAAASGPPAGAHAVPLPLPVPLRGVCLHAPVRRRDRRDHPATRTPLTVAAVILEPVQNSGRRSRRHRATRPGAGDLRRRCVLLVADEVEHPVRVGRVGDWFGSTATGSSGHDDVCERPDERVAPRSAPSSRARR